MSNSYDFGVDVTCSVVFKNAAGTVSDPDEVHFKVKDPEGEVTAYKYGTDAALVRASAGRYYVLVDASKSGTWHYRFYAIGTGKSADEGTFTINRSNFS